MLTDYVTNNGHGYKGSGNDIAKAIAATWGWNSSTTAGTPGNDPGSNNSSGFTAAPGGYRGYNGVVHNIGYDGLWWSSSEYSTTNAWGRGMYYNDIYVSRGDVGRRYGFSVRCVEDESTEIVIPSLTTQPISDITLNTATTGGVITSDGGSTVTARGVCWSTSQNPTTDNGKTTDGAGTGSYTNNLSGLTANTTYYVRAYATNSVGTAYGAQVCFTTTLAGIFDGDGNVYTTVTIGTQTWLKENLKTTTCNDGTAIPLVTDATAWEALSSPAYCWYNNDEAGYKAIYGALYNWYAVDAASNGNKNVCPSGYHVPTDAEWTVLTDYLTNNGYGYEGSGDDIAKAIAATWGWKSYTTAGTPGNDPGSNNSSGFTAVPGGLRISSGTFVDIGYIGFWWISTESPTTSAWLRYIFSNGPNISRIDYTKTYGFSVRCVGD